MENINDLNIPLLYSYPRYAALTSFLSGNEQEILWLFSNCINIYAKTDKQFELFFGKDKENYYELWFDCPYVEVVKYRKYGEVVDFWIASLYKGSKIFAMVDTEVLGVSCGSKFYHDVLISNYIDEKLVLYDFYPPSYSWNKKSFEVEKVKRAYCDCCKRKFEGFWLISKVAQSTEKRNCYDSTKILSSFNKESFVHAFKLIAETIKQSNSLNYDIAIVQFICDYFFIAHKALEILHINKNETKITGEIYKTSVNLRNYYIKSIIKNDKKGFGDIYCEMFKICCLWTELIEKVKSK